MGGGHGTRKGILRGRKSFEPGEERIMKHRRNENRREVIEGKKGAGVGGREHGRGQEGSVGGGVHSCRVWCQICLETLWRNLPLYIWKFGKEAQGIEALTNKPDYLNMVPGTHGRRRELTSNKLSPGSTHVQWHTQTHPIHTHKINEQINKCRHSRIIKRTSQRAIFCPWTIAYWFPGHVKSAARRWHCSLHLMMHATQQEFHLILDIFMWKRASSLVSKNLSVSESLYESALNSYDFSKLWLPCLKDF